MTTTCWDEEAQELVHKGHQPTGETRDEDQGSRVVTWRVLLCECGGHELLVP